jgi:hypothetical protein
VELVGEEDAPAYQVGAGASIHLPFEHFDAVDVPLDDAGAPGQAESVGDGVLVGAQAGDEGPECGLAGRYICKPDIDIRRAGRANLDG